MLVGPLRDHLIRPLLAGCASAASGAARKPPATTAKNARRGIAGTRERVPPARHRGGVSFRPAALLSVGDYGRWCLSATCRSFPWPHGLDRVGERGGLSRGSGIWPSCPSEPERAGGPGERSVGEAPEKSCIWRRSARRGRRARRQAAIKASIDSGRSRMCDGPRMRTIGEIATFVTSKNAGPFLLTLDIVFPDEATYRRFVAGRPLDRATVARPVRALARRRRRHHRVRARLRGEDHPAAPVGLRRGRGDRRVRSPAARSPRPPRDRVAGDRLRSRLMRPMTVLAPLGMLGYGIPARSMERGLARDPGGARARRRLHRSRPVLPGRGRAVRQPPRGEERPHHDPRRRARRGASRC